MELEKLLGRELHTIGCALHANELPFRALFKKLDGGSSGPGVFKGILGNKVQEEGWQDKVQVNFQPIESPLLDIPDFVLSDLSSDQRLLYEYVKGVSAGHVNDKFASWQIGPVVQSRWLTLCIRILCLYTRTAEPSQTLIKLVTFIQQVYAVGWFEIKQSSKLSETPELLFNTIQRIKSLPYKDVISIAKKNIQGNSFCLLPENFLYSMAISDKEEVSKIGWRIIQQIRELHKEEEEPDQEKQNNRRKLRKTIPLINWEANHWGDLLGDLDPSTLTEPPITRKITDETVDEFLINGNRVCLKQLPSHSQSVERSVKLVSEASKSCYGQENRHKSILVKILSRKHRPNFMSKGHYTQTYDSFL